MYVCNVCNVCNVVYAVRVGKARAVSLEDVKFGVANEHEDKRGLGTALTVVWHLP